MLREYIARSFKEHIYAIMLENLEIYPCKKNKEEYALIIEGGASPTAYLFHILNLVDIIPVEKGGDDGAQEASQKLGITIYERLPILEKLKAILDIVCLIILVRHIELTRGGEYIELTFLLDMGAQPKKIKFLWNKEIPISKIKRKHTQIITTLSIDVLNLGIRPHLTTWQAKFRRWYTIAEKKAPNESPQEIQKRYEYYDELADDMKLVNERLIVYRDKLRELVMN